MNAVTEQKSRQEPIVLTAKSLGDGQYVIENNHRDIPVGDDGAWERAYTHFAGYFGSFGPNVFVAAPDLQEAAIPFEEVIQEGTDDLPGDTKVTVKIGERIVDFTLTLDHFRALQRALLKSEGR
jgi:hypothetical protein